MKKTLLIVIFISLCVSISAQTSGGPDAYGYYWVNSNHTLNPPAYSWFDITTIGTQVFGLADDNVVGPFSTTGFQFYWYPIDQFWVGSNGYITFAGDNIASPFPASIPLSSGANDWIAPFLTDLNFAGAANSAECYYYYNSDTICISFLNVPLWVNSPSGFTGSNSFQIILNKVDKSITFNYLSTNIGTATPLDNAVGIENNTGNLGLSSMIDVLPASTFTIKYYYPTVVTYAVTDGGVNWNDNVQNGGIFIKSQSSPYDLKSNIKNFGNQNLSGFTVNDNIKNAGGSTLTNGSVSIPSLNVGVDTLITFTNTFTPSVAGTYTFNTSISGISGDMVSSNDWMHQEVIAIDTTLALMSLDYSDGVGDGGGLGWNGGNGGIGVYIEPPAYPVRIVNSKFYISANTNNVDFYAKIYDDDGPNGGPGTLLDSVTVASSAITLNVYTSVPTSDSNLVISDG